MLGWATPVAGTQQMLHYRLSGSTGPWSTLAVATGLGSTAGFSGVNISGLAPGSYQFELLWSAPNQGVPTSHATGSFTVIAGKPAYWVPPVNLPNITGLSIGKDVVGGTLVGYDESSQPIYSGGTSVPALVWNAANATLAQYRLAGGAWTSLAIDNAGQSIGESGATGLQKAVLSGLAPGTYQVQVLAGTPPAAQATANITVYAQPAGYYQTVYVQVPVYTPTVAYYQPVYTTQYGTRQVATQVWVNDPPYISGYDESGRPVYVYPGHYQTVYVTQSYSYQVQTGQTPVYARDENGNIIYSVSYQTQAQQQWVQPATPAPTLSVTTPPYTPGYWVSAIPQQYAVSVATAAGITAISTTDGAAIGQSAALNGWSATQRPMVFQTFDRWGNLTSTSDPRSAAWVTTYKYNANNQVVLRVQPDSKGLTGAGPVTSIYYDKLGRQVAVKDANAHMSAKVYDGAGDVLQQLNADGGVVNYGYDIFGDKVKSTDAMGNVVTFGYDRLGRMLTTVEGVAEVYGTTAANTVADLGRRAIVASWSYDQLGRKLTQTNGNGETVRYTCDLRGNVIATTQPLGQVERAAFDALGRKIADVDANGYASTWSYDYFGLLLASSDLGGQRYAYSYDYARQLVAQTSTRGQSITYSYDAAGQQTTIHDWADGKVTSYAYDLSGRRIRESVVQLGVTYQDNHLAYDALGRLRDVADSRVHIAMDYDNVGNRTHVMTHVGYQGIGGDTSQDTNKFFLYDEMNRQNVVDGIDAAGNIGPAQGHRVSYDKDGNRTGDSYYGNVIATVGGQSVIVGYGENGAAIYSTQPVTYQKTTGLVTESYGYDGLSRLQSVLRNGVQIDLRFYDGADRVIESGPAGNLPTQYASLLNAGAAPGDMNGSEARINRYDANGRLLHQKISNSDGSAKVDISYDHSEVYAYGLGGSMVADGYDAVGNLRGYVAVNRATGSIDKYTTSLTRYAGYEQAGTSGVSTTLSPGSTTEQYDVNGYLVGHVDPKASKTFVNDASGVVLYVNQAGNVQRQLVANGEVLGSYGVAVDPSSGGGNNPNFANLVDLDFGYARISASYPNASPGAYQVRTGDTLQSIALAAYGDAALWYRVAEANGLQSSSDLKVGQTINIPNRVSTIDNNSGTFKPYDPSKIRGDLSPTLGTPQDDGCGALGKILTFIVAAVVAYVAGPVFGDLAGQFMGNLTGVQDGFSWKELASAYVMAVVDQFVPAPNLGAAAAGAQSAGSLASAAVRAVEVNAISQAIGVATGLQHGFNWRGVAAAGIGAAAGREAASALGVAGPNPQLTGSDRFVRAIGAGVIAGTVTSIARGGRVSAVQIASDAFGNALGQSLASQSTSGGVAPAARTPFPDADGTFYGPAAQLPSLDSVAAWANQPFSPVAADRSNDVTFAAGDGYTGGVPSKSLRDENIARMQAMARDPSAAGYVTGAYSSNPGSGDYYRQPDGTFRIEIIGTSNDAEVAGGVGNNAQAGAADTSVQPDRPSFFAAPELVDSGVTIDGRPYYAHDDGAIATGVAPQHDLQEFQVPPPGLQASARADTEASFNPGWGFGVYSGALSATRALYTRARASGPYGRISGTVDGYQAHHLNQDAVYRASISYRSGQSILLPGDALRDVGSAHYQAHASLENWWESYRTGENLGSVPTNAQYGQALRQSLIDAGMSPADATQYAGLARQQRLAVGQADDAPVPRVPRRMSQPGGNVVDALGAARGLSKSLAMVGRGATVVGATVDGYNLYSQYQKGVQTGDYSDVYREGIRVAGGWAGAYAMGTAGAELGAGFGVAFTPVGAVIGGFVGGVIGGAFGYVSGSYASDGIANDVGIFLPGTPK